ncbi:DUF4351 domain-containing protein [Ectothiorhodospiraceae bacterium BW-2]|nr:DUF4351 domain-containing protein [Ectothiorhodospiraceae bacterium BW-2]
MSAVEYEPVQQAMTLLRLERKLTQPLTAYQQKRLDRLSFEQLEKLFDVLLDFANGGELDNWLQKQHH